MSKKVENAPIDGGRGNLVYYLFQHFVDEPQGMRKKRKENNGSIRCSRNRRQAGATVLAVSDGTTLKVGKPYVEGAKVVLSVAGVVKGDKVINFKAKRRKGSRRLVGHRQQLTVATVKAIA